VISHVSRDVYFSFQPLKLPTHPHTHTPTPPKHTHNHHVYTGAHTRSPGRRGQGQGRAYPGEDSEDMRARGRAGPGGAGGRGEADSSVDHVLRAAHDAVGGACVCVCALVCVCLRAFRVCARDRACRGKEGDREYERAEERGQKGTERHGLLTC